MSHGFQEDFFERVSTVRELSDEEVLPIEKPPDRIDLDARRQDDAPAPEPFGNAFGAYLGQRRAQVLIVAGHFELDERSIRSTFLLEIAVMDDGAVFHDDRLVADLLDVAQQMRADENV